MFQPKPNALITLPMEKIAFFLQSIDDALKNTAPNDAGANAPGSCLHLRSQTEDLIRAFQKAPNRFLWKEDIRQDVLYDEYASDGAVRTCVYQARKEIKKQGLPYQIETVKGKGYRLKN
jgi:DNA-binding response OmpR family regulator